MVHYHKPACLMKTFYCCVQGQSCSKTSKCQLMFVQTISSEPLIFLIFFLLPKWVRWGIIMSQSLFKKDRFAVFKVKVKGEDDIFKNMTSYYILCTADPFANKFGLIAYRHKLDCLVKSVGCSVVVKVKVARKVTSSSGCSSGRYLLKC